MNDKEYLPFKVAHLILMGITIVITCIDLFQMISGLRDGKDLLVMLRLFSDVVRIVAMMIGLIYLVTGYKKSSANYYKYFFVMLILAEISRLLVLFVRDSNILLLISGSVSVMLSIVLLAKKDLGRNRSLIVLFVLIVIELVIGIFMALQNVTLGQLGSDFSMLMLLGTAGFMISAKYIDKELRGTK